MPQAVVAAAAWIGQTVGAALTAVGASTAVASTAAALATTVSQIALTIGMQYAIDSVTRPNIKPAGSELTMNIDPAYPREMVIGERQVGGSLIARYSRDVNNYFAHVVIQVADHPCVELSKIYDGGRLVQGAPLAHGVRTEITAYSNSGGPRLWMTWHDGRPGQTADSDLVTKSATDPEVVAGKIDAWTSNHRGAGCAYVHVEIRWDPDILTSLPQFTFLLKGAKLYDRRKDTTAGGSGAHRLDDPSTWEYSTNAMVALDHYLLGYQVEGDPLAFGIGLSVVEVPYAQFEAGADLCDEDVETGTGVTIETIKRYALNGVISAGDYFLDVIEAAQIQMAARVVDLGGRIGILGAEERAITVSLTEDDLVKGEALQFADKLAFADLIGSVTGTFSDPANNFQPTPYDPLYTQYRALPDGGEARAVSLSFPYEVHPRRAVRLVSAWAARETLQPRLAGMFMPKAWKLEPGDWFEFTSARLGVTSAKFEVIDIVKSDDFTVAITARAIDPDFLAFDNDNDPDLSVPPDIAPVSLFLSVPEFDVVVSTITAGSVVEPVLEVTLTSDENVANQVVFEYAVWDSLAPPGDEVVGPTQTDAMQVSQIVTKLRKGVLPSTKYAVRAKTKAGLRESPWSDWCTPITTGSTYAVGSAAAVPWTGVTTRPANLAALAGSEPIQNALVAMGPNGIVDTGFRLTALHWAVTGSLVTPLASYVTESQLRKARVAATGSVPDNGLADVAGILNNGIACQPGDRIEASAYLGGTGWATGQVYLEFYNAANSTVAVTIVQSVSLSGKNGTGDLSSFVRAGGFLTVPATAVVARIKARLLNNTGGAVVNPSGSVAQPFLRKADATQTALSPWAPGFEAQPAADVTGSNVAASISSQGALATLNAVGAGQISAAAVTPSKLVVGDPGNMLLDDFNDNASWAQAGGTWALSVADNTERTALGAPRVAKGPAGNGTTTQASTSYTPAANIRPAIEPGRSYRFFMRALTQAGGTTRSRFRIIWYGYDGTTQVGSTISVIGTDYRTTAAVSQAVQDLSTVEVAPAGAVFAVIQPFLEYSTTLANAGTPFFSHPRIFRQAQLGVGVTLANGTTLATDALLQTTLGVAASIASQGALATKNTVAPADMVVGSLSAICADVGLLRTATSGARMELEANKQRVYDSAGNVRVKIGDLS